MNLKPLVSSNEIINISKVLYVPNRKFNLMSYLKLEENGFTVTSPGKKIPKFQEIKSVRKHIVKEKYLKLN